MKVFLLICLTIIQVLCFSSCSTGDAADIQINFKSDALEQSKSRGKGEILKPRIIETTQSIAVDPKSYTDRDIPPECLSVLRELIAYLGSRSPNIFYNEEAQQKWFAANLRKAAANHLSVYQKESQKLEFTTFPDNVTFFGVWEEPGTFQILSCSWWKNEVEIKVLFQWVEGQNYVGDNRIGMFSFIEEFDVEGNSFWKIHSINYEKSSGGYAPAHSVNERLWSYSYE